MIVLYHDNKKVISIWNRADNSDIAVFTTRISTAFFQLAEQFPDDLLVWCHISQKDNTNFNAFDEVFHHRLIMASFSNGNYLPESIGYVEESPFIKVNKLVQYPTWRMSSVIGGIYASVLNCLDRKIDNRSFNYFLSSVAKSLMPLGLFCYSEPSLLVQKINEKQTQGNTYTLFRFVSQHYKRRWTLLLFLNLLLYDKKIKLLPFLYSFFFKKRLYKNHILRDITVKSNKKVDTDMSIDVIIPTIGRKKYLYDVLKDLSAQTILPVKVIIVEQNPMEGSSSELDYIENENWPFKIEHIFTHQAGACNARNVALSKTSSNWVFLNDDDNRFSQNLIQNVFHNVKKYCVTALTTSYLLEHENKTYINTSQSGIFGSGNSFVKSSTLSSVAFDSAFEFGYGEDNDFGCQLRNNGHDIIYFPDIDITHLKAPMGGFRIPQKFQWSDDILKPKPSPTIMLLKIKNATKTQLLGYKLLLFLKLNRLNIFAFSNFNKQWNKSIYWANKLKRND